MSKKKYDDLKSCHGKPITRSFGYGWAICCKECKRVVTGPNETVSEGTPISPVFETEEEMIEWLISEGHSEKASKEFVKSGWAPSFIMFEGHLVDNIDAHDYTHN